jgi:hypothetical protein
MTLYHRQWEIFLCGKRFVVSDQSFMRKFHDIKIRKKEGLEN